MSKVLITDKNSAARLTIQKHLEAKEYQVNVSDTLSQAIQLLEENNLDVIIVNIALYRKNIIEQIQSSSAGKSIPVIIVTDEISRDKALQAVNDGAFDYIEEPIDYKHLHSLVSSSIQMAHLSEENNRLRQTIENNVEVRIQDLQHINEDLKQEIVKRNHLYAVLRSIRDINKSITQFSDEIDLLKNICHHFTESRGYKTAWIALVDDSKMLKLVASSGFKKNYDTLVNNLKKGWVPSCVRLSLKSSKVVTIKETTSHCPNCVLYNKSVGYKAIVLRIAHRGKLYGVLTISIPEDFPFENEEKTLLAGVAEDIAHAIYSIENNRRKRQAEEDIKHHEEQLRQLASDLTLSEERQRREIATMLHDGPCQSLTVLKVELQLLRQKEKDEAKSRLLNILIDQVERTNEETRSLIFNLSPPVLYELGLNTALSWLFDEFQQEHEISVEFSSNDSSDNVPEPLSVLLFQIARELMTNVSKHAKAQNIKAKFKADNSSLFLMIEDDGIGFSDLETDFTSHAEGGFGLFSIRERLRHYGGNISINSNSEIGTRAEVTLPIHIDQTNIGVKDVD